MILVLTSIPNPPVPRELASSDKLVHFAMYGGLGFLLSRALLDEVRRRQGWQGWQAVVVSTLVALAAAGIDEWHQQFIPGRGMDIGDWRADALGAVIGATVALVLSSVHRSSRSVNDS